MTAAILNQNPFTLVLYFFVFDVVKCTVPIVILSQSVPGVGRSAVKLHDEMIERTQRYCGLSREYQSETSNTLTPLHIYILFSPRIWRDIKIDGFGGEKCGKSADNSHPCAEGFALLLFHFK